MRSIYKALAPLALSATLLSATPAHALSSFCPILVFPAFVYECSTLTVPANSAGGFIHYEVSSFVGYRVIDSITNVSIAANNSGPWGHSATIFGLTNEYYVKIQGASGYAYINNT